MKYGSETPLAWETAKQNIYSRLLWDVDGVAMKAVSHNQPLTGPSAGKQTHVLVHCVATPEGTGYLRANALPNMGTANRGLPPIYPRMYLCSRFVFWDHNLVVW